MFRIQTVTKYDHEVEYFFEKPQTRFGNKLFFAEFTESDTKI